MEILVRPAGRLLVTGCLLFAVSLAVLIAVDWAVSGGLWSMLDLQVYDWGGLVARHSGNLYGLSYRHLGLRFTYPPLAAAVFAALSYAPLPVLKWLATAGSVAALTAVTWLTWGALGYPRSAKRLGATLAIAAVAIWSEPVQQTLAFGQVNILLMLIIVADLCLPEDVWWKGAGVGVAAGFKLTPLIFIPYLLLTGRLRAAGVALATFLATIMVPALLLPSQSNRYWAGRLFMDPHRLGNVGYVGNQSLYGMLLRLAGSPRSANVAWLVAVVIVGAGGLLLAAAAQRKQEMAGVVVCALTGASRIARLVVAPLGVDSAGPGPGRPRRGADGSDGPAAVLAMGRLERGAGSGRRILLQADLDRACVDRAGQGHARRVAPRGQPVCAGRAGRPVPHCPRTGSPAASPAHGAGFARSLRPVAAARVGR